MIGVALVVGSAAGVAGLIGAADRTEQAFAARHVVAAGDRVAASDLRAVRVRLGGAGDAYLAQPPRPGTVATRTIARGELVPLGALGTAAGREQTSVVIAVGGELPAAVDAGAAVDVWAAAASEQGAGAPRFDVPHVLVPGATVVHIDRGSTLGGSTGVAVEVRVPKSAAAAVLAAIANGAAITLLPVGG